MGRKNSVNGEPESVEITPKMVEEAMSMLAIENAIFNLGVYTNRVLTELEKIEHIDPSIRIDLDYGLFMRDIAQLEDNIELIEHNYTELFKVVTGQTGHKLP